MRKYFHHSSSALLALDLSRDLPGTYEGLSALIKEYIGFYNYRRPQRKLKGMIPMEYRESYLFGSFL
ncbi:MAG: IS3 family transposase [Erysipelotrichaceae bacterium]|nr:IS3 family transposase [Erysipelotrichaceae bacterium]